MSCASLGPREAVGTDDNPAVAPCDPVNNRAPDAGGSRRRSRSARSGRRTPRALRPQGRPTAHRVRRPVHREGRRAPAARRRAVGRWPCPRARRSCSRCLDSNVFSLLRAFQRPSTPSMVQMVQARISPTTSREPPARCLPLEGILLSRILGWQSRITAVADRGRPADGRPVRLRRAHLEPSRSHQN